MRRLRRLAPQDLGRITTAATSGPIRSAFYAEDSTRNLAPQHPALPTSDDKATHAPYSHDGWHEGTGRLGSFTLAAY